MSLKLNERYPGRYNNPSANYPQGSFKNRTTPTAKDGSYLEQDWANDKEGFFQSLLDVAGVDANGDVDKVGSSQAFDALLHLSQNQAGTAFATGGTATALTLTPIPAIQAYAPDQRFSVKFSVASGTNPTFNVSAKGVKSLKQYDSTGAKVAAVTATNQITDVVYDGTDFIVLDPLPAVAGNLIGIQGSAKNLIGSASGLSAVVAYTADEIVVESAANTYQVLRGVSINPTFATAGANGLDVGAANSQTASTWYSVWVIWNGATTAGLLSLSATAPTMPAGYTHKARVGWVKTDATANKYPLGFTQAGRIVQPKVAAGSNLASLQLMASGNVTYPTAVAVGSFVPPTATRICVVPVLTNATNIITVAPNASYGPALSTTNPPPMQEFSNTGGGSFNTPKWMSLESTNIYWGTNGASNYLFLFGWEDNL